MPPTILRAASALLALSLASACGPGGSGPDASLDASRDAAPSDAPPALCSSDRECSDGVFCNGAELCAPGDPGANARGCVTPSQTACRASQTCDEASARCTTNCGQNADADGDGHRATECGGDDCDDADFSRTPGRAEVCDPRNHDEDCDPTTFGARDNDGDGFVDGVCCNADAAGALHCGTDCDDMNPMIRPSAQEACNGRDDDCNGTTDEGLLRAFRPDADGDGFGSTDNALAVNDCSAPPGFVNNATDCDDANAARNPGAPEVCDGVDNDCDGMTDEGLSVTLHRDADGDLFGSSVPADAVQACGSRAGYVPNATDCDDAHAAAHPGAPEVCDGVDNDCNGMTDENVASTFYRDQDADGFGSTTASVTACVAPAGYIALGGDCDDASAARHPGATEVCDGRDDNCDGVTDEAPASRSCGSGHALLVCMNGACAVASCDVGYRDCNATLSDGCETSVVDSAGNCGGCGNQCGLAGTCASGLCDRVLSVAPGARHACAVRSNGRVVCWGDGSLGQHGDGVMASVTTSPVAVVGIADAVQVVSGTDFSCARESTGGVSCWGDATFGQLGSTPGASQYAPLRVPGINDAVDLAAGAHFACAARRTGEVWCWGRNDRGQLGTGDTSDSFLPRPAVGITRAIAVAAGDRHACALPASGQPLCWGDNASDQLGLNAADANPHPTPAPTNDVMGAIAITAGSAHTCARVVGSVARCWGDNTHGQLGNTAGMSFPGGTNVTGASVTWTTVRAGGTDTLAVDVSGTLLTWGDNRAGQLGSASRGADDGVPAAVVFPAGARPVVDGATGPDYGCAVTDDGAVYCWGANASGQLGDGTTTPRATPVKVPNVSFVPGP